MATENGSVGWVVQIIGPVVDMECPEMALPPIYQAIRVTSDGFDVVKPLDVICEVQQHLGEGRVRTVSMNSRQATTAIFFMPMLRGPRR